MTLKGTWTLYPAHEPKHAHRIEVHQERSGSDVWLGNEDPVFRGGWDVMEFKYANGMSVTSRGRTCVRHDGNQPNEL